MLYGGLADAKRNKLLFRLVLHYIMIVTSVFVPLELPMELSIAVMIIIFISFLKADSKSVVRELKAANHQNIMITGDSVCTAIIDMDHHRLGMIKSATD